MLRVVLPIAVAALTLGVIGATPALAKSSPPPSSLGREADCDSATVKAEAALTVPAKTIWHLHIGQVYTDTVTATPSIARTAAVAAIQDDNWDLDPAGTVMHLFTEWKPIHNFLFRMFSGKAFGRVFIDVNAITPLQSEIRFQGVLATHRDIEHSAAKGFAERSYATAVRDWQQEVHAGIARLAALKQERP